MSLDMKITKKPDPTGVRGVGERDVGELSVDELRGEGMLSAEGRGAGCWVLGDRVLGAGCWGMRCW